MNLFYCHYFLSLQAKLYNLISLESFGICKGKFYGATA